MSSKQTNKKLIQQLEHLFWLQEGYDSNTHSSSLKTLSQLKSGYRPSTKSILSQIHSIYNFCVRLVCAKICSQLLRLYEWFIAGKSSMVSIYSNSTTTWDSRLRTELGVIWNSQEVPYKKIPNNNYKSQIFMLLQKRPTDTYWQSLNSFTVFSLTDEIQKGDYKPLKVLETG